MSWMFVSEWILYLCFGLLAGMQILQYVPSYKRPDYHVPELVYRIIILLIAVLSFFPLLRIVLMFTKDTDVGVGVLLENVLFEFNIGQAWIVTLMSCGSLLLIHSMKKIVRDPRLNWIESGMTVVLFLAFAWGSHCTVSYQFDGFVAHGMHFFAVSVWMGILLVIGWFAQNEKHWLAFLQWFTPLAIACFLLTMVAGLALMRWLVPDVVNAWIVSYGQALLMKHLFIVPLLVFALINSVYVRHQMKRDPSFQPLPWVRAESISGMTVFAAVAVMGMQSPTENLKAVIQFEKPAKLFDWFYEPAITPDTTIQLTPTFNGVIMGVMAVLFLLALLLVAIKYKRPIVGTGFGVLFMGSAYLAFMFSVQ